MAKPGGVKHTSELAFGAYSLGAILLASRALDPKCEMVPVNESAGLQLVHFRPIFMFHLALDCLTSIQLLSLDYFRLFTAIFGRFVFRVGFCYVVKLLERALLPQSFSTQVNDLSTQEWNYRITCE